MQPVPIERGFDRLAGLGDEAGERDAFGQARRRPIITISEKPESPRRGIDRFLLAGRMALALDQIQPGFGARCWRVAIFADRRGSASAMGAGTDADIIAIAPIGEVVAGFLRRAARDWKSQAGIPLRRGAPVHSNWAAWASSSSIRKSPRAKACSNAVPVSMVS